MAVEFAQVRESLRLQSAEKHNQSELMRQLHQKIRSLMETRHLDTGLRVEYRLGGERPDYDQLMACIRTDGGKDILVLLWGKSHSYLEGAISATEYNDWEVNAVLPTGRWTTSVLGGEQKIGTVNWGTVGLLLDFEEAVSNKRFINIRPDKLRKREM
jgi:hypothetical protein